MKSATANPSPVILTGLHKSFSRGVMAVHDLSLTVNAGEFLTIVGPSGCGKTTMLRLIAGLERPDSGSITISARVCENLRPSDRQVAMVFQDSMLYPHMSVRKNLAFPLQMTAIARADIANRILQTARICGIEHLLDRKPASLSGGELQRAALARAVARQPSVLLLDEPLSSLDAPLRSRLRGEIKAIQKKLGITTLHVTHDQEEAMAIGDRIAVMRAGTIHQVGTTQEVYRRPANRFVAGFVGQPSMNFIDGQIVRSEQSVLFTDRGDLRIDLTDMLGQRAEQLTMGPAVLGIRPEHLYPAPAGASLELPLIRAHQVSMETLGDQSIVQFGTAAGDQLLARFPSNEVDCLDGTCTLSIDPRHIFLFEAGGLGCNLLLDA